MKSNASRAAHRPPSPSETAPTVLGPRAWVVAASLAACLLITFFYCPRFVLWKGLDFPAAWSSPEVNRAVDTWKIVVDPDAKIENESNQVVRWRLLFPRLAYYLGLPRWMFMSLAPLGCAATLAFLASLMLRETGSRRNAFLATVAVGAGSWYFTSMGWLTYMDSWYILGLLAASFVRSYRVVAAACILTPWIDERFILTLPVCLLVRAVYFDWLETRNRRDLLLSALVMAGLTGPYVAARLVVMFGGYDAQSAVHMEKHLANDFALVRYLRGSWFGLRFAWLYVAGLVWLFPWKKHPLLSTGAAAVLAGNLAFLQRIVAGDISRTAAALVPAAVAGAIVAHRLQPRLFAAAAPWIAVLNLLAPAEHTITTFEVPLRYFYAEYDNYKNPPMFLAPQFYNQRGLTIFQQAQANPQAVNYLEAVQAAINEFDTALKLDPQFVPAHINRGMIRFQQKQIPQAMEDVQAVLKQDRDNIDALFLQGVCLQASGLHQPALQSFNLALAAAPPEWNFRNDALQRQRELQRQLLAPAGGS